MKATDPLKSGSPHFTFKYNNLPDDLEYLSELGNQKMAIQDRDMISVKKSFESKYKHAAMLDYFYQVLSVLGVVFMISVKIIFTGNEKTAGRFSQDFKAGLNQAPIGGSSSSNIKPVDKLELETKMDLLWSKERFYSKSISEVKSVKNSIATTNNELLNMESEKLRSIPMDKDSLEMLSRGLQGNYRFIESLKVANYNDYYFYKESSRDLNYRGERAAQFTDANDHSLWINEHLREEIQTPATEILSLALRNFSKGNFKSSDVCFLQLLDINPKDVNALFYLGMSNFRLGNYEKACGYFDSCLDLGTNPFYEEAEFYWVNSLVSMGKLAEATPALERIISQKGFYAERASKLLQTN